MSAAVASPAEPWDSLSEAITAALCTLPYGRDLDVVADAIRMPTEQLRHALEEGGTADLADRVLGLLRMFITDLSTVAADLRSTRDAVIERDRLTGVLP